jgi:hypothetical protein
MKGRRLYSEKVAAGRRTYFLDLKETGPGDRCLTITESKRVGEDKFERHGVLVAQEDLEEFWRSLEALFLRAGLLQRTELEWMHGKHSVKEAKDAEVAPKKSFEEIRAKYAKAYERWTEEEDANLKLAYETCKEIETLANTFQRQPGSVRSRLTKLGLGESV